MRLRHLALLIGLLPIAVSGNSVSASLRPDGLRVAVGPTGQVVLHASRIPLNQVLQALSEDTGVALNYAEAPASPVSVICQGNALPRVLQCLLGTQASLVIERDGNPKARPKAGGFARIRLLASTFAEAPQLDPEVAREIDMALALSHSLSPEDRAHGLQKLARIEAVSPEALREAYQAALGDEEGDVRAEAITGMVLLDAENSFPLLSQAMSDEHPSVRLAALDGMDEADEKTLPYYQQALTDPDESIRALAGLRLGIE